MNRRERLTDQILFIGDLVSDDVYEEYLSGHLSGVELVEKLRLISDWQKKGLDVLSSRRAKLFD